MNNRLYDNPYIRLRAVQLTRYRFWPLLGMMLITMAVNATISELTTALFDRMNGSRMNTLALMADTSSIDLLLAALRAFLVPENLIFLVLWAVSGLVSATLMLGQATTFLDVCRGVRPNVLGCFSRVRQGLRAWGLVLLVELKVLLWTLPGLAVSIVLAVIAISTENRTLTNILPVMIWILAAAGGIPASLRYSLSIYYQADDPQARVRESIRRSKATMKGLKWQYFKLGVPIILKAIGSLLLVSFLLVLVMTLIGQSENEQAMQIVAYIAALPMTYFLIQQELACCLFYEGFREPAAAEAAEKAPKESGQ